MGCEIEYPGRSLPTFRKNQPVFNFNPEDAGSRLYRNIVMISQTIRRHIPEDNNHHGSRRLNLKFGSVILVLFYSLCIFPRTHIRHAVAHAYTFTFQRYQHTSQIIPIDFL
jgi:hypothetical protein